MKFYLVFIFSIFFFLFSAPVFAAELFIGSPGQEKVQTFAQGDEFLANAFLNTDGDSINTVQTKILFPEALLELKEIRNGNSIVNFWINQPKVTSAGVVNFSGIITGGYTGTAGQLFSIVFLAKANGKGAVNFGDIANVLLNDGKGTQASLKTSPLEFSILKAGLAIQSTVEPLKDTTPPDNFKPEIVQNSEMFDGKYFLVFVAKDIGTGIDHYEIYESKSETKNLTNVKWNITESPYVLQDQKLQSFIYVKAVDEAGNGRISAVGPRYPIQRYKTWWIWCIIILGIIILFIVGKILWKKFKNK